MTQTLKVFFDGGCPLCVREIGFYRRQKGAEFIRWIDIAEDSAGEVAPGLSRCDALARFHIQKPNGELVNGGAAFAELWAVLPRFAPAGRLLRRQPFVTMANVAYDVFLRIRPSVQSIVARIAPLKADAS